ncbi:MAG: hypothetical protein EZS28_028795 [Streblomastix strix]|uniref:Uncharacterized protein n=1 Tax=Streblomastix strix TaxID=222440 RepID=A0A5J4UYT0_9EUKA|nr:MAG: hypothetical protein EZS28_028795 [Streblomastix strix]
METHIYVLDGLEMRQEILDAYCPSSIPVNWIFLFLELFDLYSFHSRSVLIQVRYYYEGSLLYDGLSTLHFRKDKTVNVQTI